MALVLNATLARLLEEVQQEQQRVEGLAAKHSDAVKAMENARTLTVELRIKLDAAKARQAEAQQKYASACLAERNSP